MQKILPQQNRRLHQLLNETGMKEEKKNLVHFYSSIGAESSKDLLPNEADNLIRHLESLLPPKDDPADRMRKKIIHLARNMSWEKDGAADMDRIDDWCKRSGMFKKDLNSHSIPELAKLVTQFGKVYESFKKGVRQKW